jgi:hypothetical protein
MRTTRADAPGCRRQGSSAALPYVAAQTRHRRLIWTTCGGVRLAIERRPSPVLGLDGAPHPGTRCTRTSLPWCVWPRVRELHRNMGCAVPSSASEWTQPVQQCVFLLKIPDICLTPVAPFVEPRTPLMSRLRHTVQQDNGPPYLNFPCGSNTGRLIAPAYDVAAGGAHQPHLTAPISPPGVCRTYLTFRFANREQRVAVKKEIHAAM